MVLTVRTTADVDEWLARIEGSTARAVQGLAAIGSPTEMLKRIKFEPIGFHPVEDRALNLIEQVNQTFTYLVALRAARWLLDHHPEAGAFHLAPGADMARRLDIMSEVTDLVGAETFASVHPDNNRKLAHDLAKLAADPSRHRYVFFYAPGFAAGRQPRRERHPGVEVHCIDL